MSCQRLNSLCNSDKYTSNQQRGHYAREKLTTAQEWTKRDKKPSRVAFGGKIGQGWATKGAFPMLGQTASCWAVKFIEDDDNQNANTSLDAICVECNALNANTGNTSEELPPISGGAWVTRHISNHFTAPREIPNRHLNVEISQKPMTTSLGLRWWCFFFRKLQYAPDVFWLTERKKSA